MITKEEITKFLAKPDEAELEAVKDKNDSNLHDTWLIIAASYRDLARLRVLKDQPGSQTGPAPETDVEIMEGHIREAESQMGEVVWKADGSERSLVHLSSVFHVEAVRVPGARHVIVCDACDEVDPLRTYP